MSLQRVLVGVDGSAASVGAVRAAMELVAPAGELLLARVVETSLVRRALDLAVSGGLPRAARARRRLRAESSLAQLALVIGAQTRARVDARVTEGAVAASLVAACAERGCELIVVGDRRPRALARLLPGGVVRRLVETSPVPTLVVPEFAVLHRVRGALVLAPTPDEADLREVARLLGPLRPSVEFMAVGGAPERGRAGLAGETQRASADDRSSGEAGERSRIGVAPRRGLDHWLQALTSRTVLVAPPRTAQDLGASWLLDHTSGPVLFMPARHVPRGPAIDTEGGHAETPAARAGRRAEATTT